jgi:hypothetical protein
MDRACRPHGGEEECIRVLVENSEGKRLLESQRRSWEDNIKRDLS